MKITNYKRGYNNTFDCSIHGTIRMTREEWEEASRYLINDADRIRHNHRYFNSGRLKEDIERKIITKHGFLINIRVDATAALVKHFNLKNYKRGNYQIEVSDKKTKARLEYLRGEIKAERISYEEIAELQSLAKYIEPGDVELLEWAGVPENN
jgi:hypothetical protein